MRTRVGGRSSAQPQAGFTLIEISVVVLIIALMLTTATVRLDNYLPSSRGESAARDVLASLDLARLSAIAYGRVYGLEFDMDEQRYRIQTPFDETGKVARSPDDRVSMKWQSLPSGVRFGSILTGTEDVTQDGKYLLQFSALGAAENLHIYLENDAGEGYTLTVRVVALTGHSKVMQGRVVPEPVSEDDF